MPNVDSTSNSGPAHSPGGHCAAVDHDSGVKPSATALQAALQRWRHGQVASPVAEHVAIERRQESDVGLHWWCPQRKTLLQYKSRLSLDPDLGETSTRSRDARSHSAAR